MSQFILQPVRNVFKHLGEEEWRTGSNSRKELEQSFRKSRGVEDLARFYQEKEGAMSPKENSVVVR